MSIIGWKDSHSEQETVDTKVYRHEGFRHYLKFCQKNSQHNKSLMVEVMNSIRVKYPHYTKALELDENRELIPLLVAYTLFEWPATRGTTIGKKNRHLEVRT